MPYIHRDPSSSLFLRTPSCGQPTHSYTPPPLLRTWPILPLPLLPFPTFRSFFIRNSLIPPYGLPSPLSLPPCLCLPSLSLSQLRAAVSSQTRDRREGRQMQSGDGSCPCLPTTGRWWDRRLGKALCCAARGGGGGGIAVRAARSGGAVTQAPRDTGPPGARDLICSLTASQMLCDLFSCSISIFMLLVNGVHCST